MANNAQNVTAAKPKVAGAVLSAPVGTALPTDTATALDKAFVGLGFCSDEGLSNELKMDSETIKAWGGATVLSIQKSKDDKFKFTLIEGTSADVLKFVHGSKNVTGTLATGMTVKVNDEDVEEKSIVIDMILRGGIAKRIVIPDCKISEIGEVKYSDNDVVGYEVTVECMPDANGNKHYEYLLKSA